ncbi:hypothetical protein LOAG_16939 [Loa loa]|uniref:Uncharacterized protein n=1 Tax=Loa loa TaxID=7209 RepID=A0A1S0UKJ6_LOALO|nr:hypothetical protein LOAG_16939 [Loa loa]EJD76053.1 hypothetical protein LOAG_16939 [Loa loa]
MNERTFEIAKNLHLNWYIYAIKALLGQVGKQMYRQLTEDKQKMLALCLDQIKDDHDLVAGAKCLIQARHKAHFSTCGQDFKHDRGADKSSDTPAFITSSDFEEEEFLKNHDCERKKVKKYHRMSTRGKTSYPSHLGSENKFSKRDPAEASIQFSRFSNILHLTHVKNFTPHNFNTFEHLSRPIPLSDSPNQQKLRMSREVYLNRLLLPIDRESGDIHLTPRKNLTRKNGSFETSYLIENEIRRTTKLVGQSSNSLHYEKGKSTRSKRKNSEKSELVTNINLPAKSKNFRKSDEYYSIFNSSSERSEELYLDSVQSKIRKKKLWQRWRRSYRLITNHVMKSDHLIVDASDLQFVTLSISFISFQLISKAKQVAKMPAMHDSTVKKTPIQQVNISHD